MTSPGRERVWGEHLALVLAWAAEHGHAAVPQHARVGEVALGGWVANQRREYHRGRLPAHRVSLLEAVPGWRWVADGETRRFGDERWWERHRMLLAWAAEHGHGVVPQSVQVDGFSLGQWAKMQRLRYRGGTLPADQVAALEAVPGWSWAPATGRPGRPGGRRVSTARPITEDEAAVLRAAPDVGVEVRRLQSAGVTSASIARALGRSVEWVSRHYPRSETRKAAPHP